MLAQRSLQDRRAWLTTLANKPFWSIVLFFLLTSCSMSATASPSPTPTNTLPTVAVAQPFHGTAKTLDGALTVTLDITPNHSGPNVFTVTVLDNQTSQPAKVSNVTLYTTMQDMAMGTDSMTLQANSNGQFSSTSNNLNMVGHWGIAIAIQTPDHVIHKVGLRVVTAL